MTYIMIDLFNRELFFLILSDNTKDYSIDKKILLYTRQTSPVTPTEYV